MITDISSAGFTLSAPQDDTKAVLATRTTPARSGNFLTNHTGEPVWSPYSGWR